MHLLLDWAQTQDKYAQASQEYKTLFENGTDEEQFQLRYNMEEAADAPYLNYIFRGENAVVKERSIEFIGDRIDLPQADFNQATQQVYSTPLTTALYHAVALQRGKDYGIDAKSLETLRKKTEMLMTTLGGSALKDFQTALKMTEASSAYAKSPEFQAYVDKFLPEKVRDIASP